MVSCVQMSMLMLPLCYSSLISSKAALLYRQPHQPYKFTLGNQLTCAGNAWPRDCRYASAMAAADSMARRLPPTEAKDVNTRDSTGCSCLLA